jgi:hypothetical protein
MFGSRPGADLDLRTNALKHTVQCTLCRIPNVSQSQATVDNQLTSTCTGKLHTGQDAGQITKYSYFFWFRWLSWHFLLKQVADGRLGLGPLLVIGTAKENISISLLF